MNNELEKDLKGSVRNIIEVLSVYLLEGLRKTTKTSFWTAGGQAEVTADQLLNTILQH
jgi:hypothetical protein